MKINKKIVILVIIIISIAIILSIGYKILNNRKENKDNSEDIYLTPDLVIELSSYVPFSFANVNEYYDAYHGGIVSVNDTLPVILSSGNIGSIVKKYNSEFKDKLQEYGIEYGNVYLTNDIDNFLSKRYNFKLKDISNISDIQIIKLDNKYSAINIEYNSNILITMKCMISVADAYLDDNNKIIIFEKALIYEIRDDGYYVYKNSNLSSNNIIKKYEKIDEFGNELGYIDIYNKIKEDFVDYKGKFKHTFKKNKTGYYWYSTEFIEDK